MNNEKIEIPFGAFDFKLGGFEYTIPDGFEAEIKDGKVIVKKAESEDEKIRQALIRFFKNTHDWVNLKYDGDEIVAYLEKQKDEAQRQFNLGMQAGREEVMYEMEKEPHYSPLCNTIKDKIREYVANHFIADRVVKTDMKSIVKAMEEGVRLGKEEQKPAEKDEIGYDLGREKGMDAGIEYVLNHLELYGLCKPVDWSEEPIESKPYITEHEYIRKDALLEWAKNLKEKWEEPPMSKHSPGCVFMLEQVIKKMNRYDKRRNICLYQSLPGWRYRSRQYHPVALRFGICDKVSFRAFPSLQSGRGGREEL